MKRVRFHWMGAYWSCAPLAWAALRAAVETEQPFDLHAMGCRELKCRPHGNIEKLRDVDRRTRE